MIQTMLIPVDDVERAEKAIRHVASIATPYIQVHLLGIMDIPERQFIDPVAWNIAKSSIQALLTELAAYLETKRIETTWDILENPALDVFIRHIEQSQCDLIVLGTDDNGDAPLLQTLVRLSSVPVLIARGKADALKYRKILVPLDESQRAECVLPLATSLAKMTRSKLIFAHVIRKPEMPRRTLLSSEDVELAQRLIERNQIEAEQYLHHLSQRQGVETETRLLVDDSVTNALHNLIQSECVDLVVLSAHGYSGESRVSLGGVASNLLDLCSASMIVLQDLPAPVTTFHMEAVRNKMRDYA